MMPDSMLRSARLNSLMASTLCLLAEMRSKSWSEWSMCSATVHVDSY